MMRLFALNSISVLVLLFVVQVVNGIDQTNNAGQYYCGDKPCIEPMLISCEEMIETYEFRGSCCSLESITATGGCRLTVSYGNCYWYPFCGVCDELNQKEQSRCHNVFETDANQKPCPLGDYDPLTIQQDPSWYPPSCAPSMSPTNSSMGADDESSDGNIVDYYYTPKKRIIAIVCTTLLAVISTTIFLIA